MKRSFQVVLSTLLGLVILGFWWVALPHTLWATPTVLTVNVVSSTTPPGGGGGSTSTPPGGGGGGGGGGGNPTPVAYSGTYGEVDFQGMAYPGSAVTLMRDGQQLARTTAGPDAMFRFQIKNVTPGTYTYAVQSTDYRGVRSILNSFTVAVTPSVGTIITGIFLPPTIDVDKTEVRRGDPLTILGQSVPGAVVTVMIHSVNEMMASSTSDAKGAWKYVVDTLQLEYGTHDASARSKNAQDISSLSALVNFTVGTTNTMKINKPDMKADINKDGHVNLIDFSILAYWYKRPLTSAGFIADQNNDGVIDLKDFSIVAYYWTG